VVKMQRGVYEGLEGLAEASSDPALRAQVDALIASLTKAQVRTQQHHAEVSAPRP
jgi:hypothetical protein